MANPLPTPDYGPIRIRLLSQCCALLPITIYERLASTRHKAKVYAIIRKIGNMPERSESLFAHHLLLEFCHFMMGL